jgi:thiol-disulfide isomerase/thioredoxin
VGQPVEGLTVRVVPCVCLLAALAGCKSTPKDRPAPAANVQSGQGNTPFWADANNNSRTPGAASIAGGGSSAPRGDPVSMPGNDPEISGILAGRLVDGYGRSPGLAYVQVSVVRDGRAEPIADVETVSQGHFYIRGLQPGRTYKLVARTRQDGRVLVGEVQARPPETRLLIPLGEELAGSATPPIPSAPLPPQASNPKPETRNPKSAPPPVSWDDTPAAGLGPPSFGPSDQIAAASATVPPRITVPPANPGLSTPAGACVISGGRVISLRLPDADGREWDFGQRRGRLILFDFWGTWCGPCLRAVPELSRLNATYGAAGLEVIGIACERGSPAENAGRVRSTRQRLNIGYRLVLGDSSVQDQFHVTAYPTLVLVDGEGALLWRGAPDQSRELEGIIRRRLGY